MATMTLTEFLLARIAEDEAEASSYIADLDQNPPSVYDAAQVGWIDAGSPERVLAECEAKRRIVEDHEWDETPGSPIVRARELRHLAAVYADHPDYDEEWRA